MLERTVIVDGNSLWWRCCMSTTFRNGGEFAFLTVLLRVKKLYGGPILVAWDSWCQWRRDLLPQYKASRKPVQEEAAQLKAARDAFILKLQHIVPNYFSVGQEGDDVIATLCTLLQTPIVIYGLDHDLFQLVSDRVVVCRHRRNPPRLEEVTTQNLDSVVPVNHPRQVPWFMALQGCKADNIPGCRIPEKILSSIIRAVPDPELTASQLLEAGQNVIAQGKRLAQWLDFWNKGFFWRNFLLVNLLGVNFPLQIMYQPDKAAVVRYLQERLFVTIQDKVLTNLCDS